MEAPDTYILDLPATTTFAIPQTVDWKDCRPRVEVFGDNANRPLLTITPEPTPAGSALLLSPRHFVVAVSDGEDLRGARRFVWMNDWPDKASEMALAGAVRVGGVR